MSNKTLKSSRKLSFFGANYYELIEATVESQ